MIRSLAIGLAALALAPSASLASFDAPTALGSALGMAVQRFPAPVCGDNEVWVRWGHLGRLAPSGR